MKKERKLWLIQPVEHQPGGLYRAVVQAFTRKEARDVLFADYKGKRFKTKVEQLGTCDFSFTSWIVCIQLSAKEHEGGE